MSEKIPESAYEKPAASMELQHNLSNLVPPSLVEDGSNWLWKTEMPEHFKDMAPDELLSEIQNLKLKEHLDPEAYDLLAHYRQYVSNLKQTRNSQRDQIHKALEDKHDPIDRRKAFLRATSWSGPLQRRILEKMQSSSEYSGRLFTDLQITDASQTEDGFIEMVGQSSLLYPNSFFNILPELKQILPHDQLIALVKPALDKKPSCTAIYHAELMQMFPDEYPDMFCKAASVAKSGLFITKLMNNEDLRKSIGEEKAKAVTKLCLENDLSFLSDVGDEFWQSGLIDDAMVQNVVLNLKNISHRRESAIIRATWDHLDESAKDVCRKKMALGFKDQLFYDITDVYEYKGMVSDEELRQKARSLLLNTEDNFIISENLDIAQNSLTPEEFRVWLRDVIFTKKYKINLDRSIFEQVFKSDMLNAEEHEKLLLKMIDDYPDFVFDYSNLFLKDKTGEERNGILAELAYDIPTTHGLSRLIDWLPYKATTPESQHDVLIEYCLRDGDVAFIKGFVNQRDGNENMTLFRSLLSNDDVLEILNKKSEIVAENVFSTLESIRKLLGGDEKLKVFIEKIRQSSELEFIENLDKVAYLYDPNELAEIVDRNIPNLKMTGAIFEQISTWSPKIGPESTREILDRHIEYVALLPRHVERIMEFVPEIDIHKLFDVAKKSNPAAMMFFASQSWTDNAYASAGIKIDAKEIRFEALLNESQMACAPRFFRNFWANFTPDSDTNEDSVKHLVKAAAFAYLHSVTIEKSGLGEKHRELATKCKTAEEEQEVLSTLISYVNLKNKGLTAGEDESRWATKEDLDRALFSCVSEALGQGASGGTGSLENFIKTMKTTGPFVSYLSQYHNSPLHREILAGMFQSISQGNYSEWKYGTEGDFGRFKKNGWLPKNLTDTQYETWKKDEVTSLHESLQSSAADVANDIKKILIDNAEHLEIQAFERGLGNPSAIIEEAKTELKLIGAELAAAGKEVSRLKKEGKADGHEMETVVAKKTRLEQLRLKLVTNRDVARLSLLTPEEVTSGYLIEGGKKTQTIEQFMNNLRANTPSGGSFVIDRIDSTLMEFKMFSGNEKEDVVCEDTCDPKITIEIGENPVESCQNYESGGANDCLLGYTEPNTKILVVKNHKGKIVARSVLRLLSNQEGEVMLQVERVYTPNAGSGVRKAIFEHASKKAESMGIKLSGDEEDVPFETGFAVVQTSETLVSIGARAPKVYVDSAGGSKSWGKYKIRDVGFVKKAV